MSSSASATPTRRTGSDLRSGQLDRGADDVHLPVRSRLRPPRDADAAIAEPHREGLVRAALTTEMMGVSGEELVRRHALEAGAEDAVMSNHWAEGGQGSVELAEAVVQAQQPLPQGIARLH